MNNAATIQVERVHKIFNSRAAQFLVYINGELRASLKSGESASMAVNPGDVKVSVTVDSSVRQTQHFKVNPEAGQVVKLKCEPFLKPGSGLLSGREAGVRIWRA